MWVAGDLERRADHPHGRKRVGVIVAGVAVQQTRQVTLELGGEAHEGVAGRTVSEMPAQERTRGVAQLGSLQARAGVEAHELGVGRQNVL